MNWLHALPLLAYTPESLPRGEVTGLRRHEGDRQFTELIALWRAPNFSLRVLSNYLAANTW